MPHPVGSGRTIACRARLRRHGPHDPADGPLRPGGRRPRLRAAPAIARGSSTSPSTALQKSVSAPAENRGPLGDKGYRSSTSQKADFCSGHPEQRDPLITPVERIPPRLATRWRASPPAETGAVVLRHHRCRAPQVNAAPAVVERPDDGSIKKVCPSSGKQRPVRRSRARVCLAPGRGAYAWRRARDADSTAARTRNPIET